MSTSPLPVPSRLPAWLEAMRPKQWAKNALLFAGLLFTQDQYHTLNHWVKTLAGFLLFCLLSGLTYYINDLLDVSADRQHPKKRFRPIPSGRLPVGVAKLLAGLGIPALLVAARLIEYDQSGVAAWKFFGAAALYLVTTLLYSFVLKHHVIVDVLTLASLFVIRAVAGAFVINVPLSEWLLLCTLLLALFLGLSKRRGELVALGEETPTRAILKEYSLPMLEQMITIVASACVMSYTLYTFFSKSQTGQSRPYLMATIPFVLYGLFRYLYLTHKKGMGEAPEAVLVEDKPLVINVLLWALVAMIVLRV
ncbi:decaprenyl-phosphate phosphoribosyltransferase [Armatimonas sp.]|uniref:decaprenyl-phosphate phosphoribosyltransferase n=1 Tax=Armatimonas sp. TaxID=1872638 RepID=UPI00286D43C3|nr:decaprenyl-phosphate phosphoribosyltransferase [Armatimonas sp.]